MEMENEEDLQAHYERKFSPAVLESEILHKDSQYFFAFIIMNLRVM